MSKVSSINRRVVFINRFFYPDHSATSQILSDLVFYLSSQGFNIEIVTSRQKYGDADARLDKFDIINGVKVNRIWTTKFGRQNLLGRAVDYLSFYFSALIYLLFSIKSGEVVVAKTDPPLISIIAALMTKLKGANLINWIQDLFPEIARFLGVKGVSLVYPLLLSMRNYSLKSAYKNIVIGDLMSQRLQSEGVDKSKIKVIHNWSIEDNIVPLEAISNPLRIEWGLQGKFIVGYSGNIGRAHDFETLIETAKSLVANRNIVFVIIGAGAQYNKIMQKIHNIGLENIIFKPYQPKEKLQYSLTLPDIHVISLIPELEGLIVPSKFYGILASGRPILYIGDSNGEIPQIIKANRCGETVGVGEYSSAVNFIESLENNSSLVNDMSINSRRIFDEKYYKKNSFNSWIKVLKPLVDI